MGRCAYILFLLLLFNLRLFCQTIDTNTRIIGIFQIGKSDTTVITQLSRELGKNYTKARTCDPLSDETNIFAEFISDSNNMAHQCEGYVVPDVRTFYLSVYRSGLLDLKGVSLTFYHNVLVDLNCPMTPALQELMNSSYGSGTIGKQDEVWPCGAKRDSMATMTEITKWWTTPHDRIVIYSDSLSIPNPGDCAIHSQSTLYVRDLIAIKSIEQIQTEMYIRFIRRSKK
jgi:hypothetical protein